MEGFSKYRTDEDLKKMQELRGTAIVKTEIYLSDKFVCYE